MTARGYAGLWLGLMIGWFGLLPGGMTTVRGADLTKYISPDFCAALVIHPERIGKSTLATALSSGLPKEMAEKGSLKDAFAALAKAPGMVIPPGFDGAKLATLLEGKNLRRVVIVIDPMPIPGLPVAPGFIVQFAEDVDGQGIVAAACSDWKPAESEGTKYMKWRIPEPGAPEVAVVVPDSKTLIVGLDATVVKMLAKSQGDQPLVHRLRKASFDNDILFEFLVEPLTAKLVKGTSKSIDQFLEFIKDAKSASLTLNFSGDKLLHTEVATVKPETAAMYSVSAQAVIGVGKQQFETMKKNPPPFVPKPLVPALSKLGDEVFNGLTSKVEGTQMQLDMAMPASLADTLKTLGPMAAAFAPKAPAAGGPPPR
jgi:hypothetical protein